MYAICRHDSLSFTEVTIGVFPKWSRTFTEFRESDRSLKHELGSIKDPVSNMCLAGAVVACWSLTQEVAGWQV